MRHAANTETPPEKNQNGYRNGTRTTTSLHRLLWYSTLGREERAIDHCVFHAGGEDRSYFVLRDYYSNISVGCQGFSQGYFSEYRTKFRGFYGKVSNAPQAQTYLHQPQ
jgi:hypothetical protein